MEKPHPHSCWYCLFHKSSPTLLLGDCLYFENLGQEKKEITKVAMLSIEQKGCKFWEEEEKCL